MEVVVARVPGVEEVREDHLRATLTDSCSHTRAKLWCLETLRFSAFAGDVLDAVGDVEDCNTSLMTMPMNVDHWQLQRLWSSNSEADGFVEMYA